MFTLGTTPSFLFKAFKATTKTLKLQQNSNKTTQEQAPNNSSIQANQVVIIESS